MADFLSINDVLDNLDIKPGMTASEFGCGLAYFALALAKKLRTGRMYALDIQAEKLSALKSKLAADKLNNVVSIMCDLESPNGSTLQGGSQDIILIPNVLFQASNKSAILKEAHRILKSSGQCLVLEWLNQNHLVSKDDLASPEEIKKIAEKLHFTLKKEFAAGDYHYGMVFVK